MQVGNHSLHRTRLVYKTPTTVLGPVCPRTIFGIQPSFYLSQKNNNHGNWIFYGYKEPTRHTCIPTAPYINIRVCYNNWQMLLLAFVSENLTTLSLYRAKYTDLHEGFSSFYVSMATNKFIMSAKSKWATIHCTVHG